MHLFATVALVVLVGCSGTAEFADRVPLPDPCVLVRDDAAARPRATLADVAWLEGEWRGKALGGEVEETWGPPKAGAMLCMFRLVKDGKPVFYELVAIVEVDGSLEVRVKHFHPDLTGWEERTEVQTFPLVRVDANTAWFDGMTFHRDGADAMRAWVRVQRRDGTATDEAFEYRRAPR
jgi:hypothetical protein